MGPTRLAMTAAVDASALLALLFGEPGAEVVADVIAAGAAASAVNFSEVATVLVRHRKDPREILAPVREQLAVEPFTDVDALAAAHLYRGTSKKGLSLGDRACLALARRLGGPAVTAEQAWAGLKIGIEVQLIRSRPAG